MSLVRMAASLAWSIFGPVSSMTFGWTAVLTACSAATGAIRNDPVPGRAGVLPSRPATRILTGWISAVLTEAGPLPRPAAMSGGGRARTPEGLFGLAGFGGRGSH